jgi:hypothetical protein
MIAEVTSIAMSTNMHARNAQNIPQRSRMLWGCSPFNAITSPSIPAIGQ